MTDRLFLESSDQREMIARVVASGPDGVVLDRTLFYARSGGQPGDAGTLHWDGGALTIADTIKGEGDAILHVPTPDGVPPPVGAEVKGAVDWDRRGPLMRMHTTLHLLCAALPGAAVTGGQIGGDRSRLDFDLPEPPPRNAIEERLNALIAADHPVAAEWVDESVLDENPALVRTLSVKPPRGTGRLRLVRIGAGEPPVDLQPCGGTHIGRTGLIGPVKIVKIENKGRQNRRIVVALA
ncbi:MAG TPA: alanyl-tRNA editing protein [Acetobacteraceae bacterium]|jgi:misacylated tRNA(Ala) deacylase|nr:alanyl-tRNA editing protein [Acetobacteraceae bacterium]